MKIQKLASTLLLAALIAPALTFAKPVDIDTAQSSVRWTGKKVGDSHTGSVSIQSGQIDLDGSDVKGGQITLDMNSIKTEDIKDAEKNAKLTGHLKSDDFFGVSKNPTAVFKIKSVKPLKDKADATHEITGDLTIKGITEPITFPAKIEIKDSIAAAKGKMIVDRSKYNVRYGSGKFFENLGNKMINDNFELDFDLKSKAQPAVKPK